jgi:hypothetical protein
MKSRYMKLMFPAGAPGSALAAAASTGTPLKSLDYQPMTAAHGGAGRVQPVRIAVLGQLLLDAGTARWSKQAREEAVARASGCRI